MGCLSTKETLDPLNGGSLKEPAVASIESRVPVNSSENTVRIYMSINSKVKKGRRLYHPGQYAIFLFEGPKGPARTRQYTLQEGRGKEPNDFSITVRRKPGGKISNEIVDPGSVVISKVSVIGFGGKFHWRSLVPDAFDSAWSPRPGVEEPRKVLMLCGGAGVTPMFSLLSTAFCDTTPPTDSPARIDVVLLYSETTGSCFCFEEEFSMWEKAPGSHRLKVIRFTTREDRGDAVHGRITASRVMNMVPDAKSRTILMCGPDSFHSDLEKGLKAAGVTQKIYREAF